MAGFTTTGLGLPAATSAFASAAATAFPATVTPTGSGLTVQGQGGSTTLPAASPSDFAGTNPTPLDRPDSQYPSLITSHVAVLRAIGTPDAVIAQLNGQQPQAEYLDRYIQGEILQNPEGWDDYVGNPRGTARAGLQQNFPGVQLPEAGRGQPGYLQDGSPVSGINVPGLSTPLLDPVTGAPQGGGGGLVTGLLAAAAVVGVGLLGWKLFKGHKAADVAKLAQQSFASGVGAGGTGEANTIAMMGKQMLLDGLKTNDVGLLQRGVTMGVLGNGAGAIGGASAAATAESIMKGMGPANGFINSTGLSALHFNMPMNQAVNAALADRYMGVLEMATRSGQLADFAATQVAMRTALTGGAATAATGVAGNAGLRELLTAAAHAIPM